MIILATDLEQTVCDARDLLKKALNENDFEMAQQARGQFSDAACHAANTGRFMLASSLTSTMWHAFKIEQLIQDFRSASISESLFKLCINLFPPTPATIGNLDKTTTRLDIDLMLVEALIEHDDPQCNKLLYIISDLTYRASHKALDVIYKRFFSIVTNEFIEAKNATPLLRYINEYGRDYPAGKKTPASLLRIFADNQPLIIRVCELSVNTFSDKTLLNLDVLKQLHRTGAHDIVNAMAPAWMFNTESPWSLTDIEAMGFSPKFSKLKSNLHYNNEYNVCSAVYALYSENVDTELFESYLEHLGGVFKSWMKALEHVCKEIPTAQRSELLSRKIHDLLLSVCSMDRIPSGYPKALLSIEGLEQKSILEIPMLHETMLCVDLGL